MPFVPAICTQCGSELRVDSSREAAICPYCRTPFVTETAINNYNANYTTNVEHLHADVVNINDDKSIDSRVRSGETFIKLDDYAAAEGIFRKLTRDCPYDYRGWWGLIKVYSKNFEDVDINRTKLQEIEELYKKTCIVASAEEHSKMKSQYDNYHDYVKRALDAKLIDTQKQLMYLQSEFEQETTEIKEKMTWLENRKGKIAGIPTKVGAYFALFVVGVIIPIIVYANTQQTGETEPPILIIVAYFVFVIVVSALCPPVATIIGIVIGGVPALITTIFVSAEKDRIDSQIRPLNEKLSIRTKDYTAERDRLYAIMEKVR